MSKPDFVPNDALFFASSLSASKNILHAIPRDENNLDIWIEDEKECLLVTLDRKRVRKVAQALLRWAGKTEPEEI